MLQAIIFDYDGTISKTMERQYKWFQYWWNHEINKEKVKGRDFPYKNFKSFMEMFNEKINHVDWVQNVYNFLGLSSDLKDLNHPVWVNYRNFCLEHPSNLYPGIKQAIKDSEIVVFSVPSNVIRTISKQTQGLILENTAGTKWELHSTGGTGNFGFYANSSYKLYLFFD